MMQDIREKERKKFYQNDFEVIKEKKKVNQDISEFIKNALSPAKIKRIKYNYRGVSPETLKMELEAFAVAEIMDARSIAKGVMAACKVEQM